MLSEEEKKAIKYFKNRLKDVQTNYTSMYYKVDNLEILLNLIEKQQAQIEKKDNIINKMADELFIEYTPHFNTQEQCKEYFTKLVEEKNK